MVRCGDISKVFFKRPNIRVNGHIIVIEYHQKVGATYACMVQCLKGQPCGHSAVTYYSNVPAVIFFFVF